MFDLEAEDNELEDSYDLDAGIEQEDTQIKTINKWYLSTQHTKKAKSTQTFCKPVNTRVSKVFLSEI